MSWADFRWALQALAEKRVGTRVRAQASAEDAVMEAGKKAASGV